MTKTIEFETDSANIKVYKKDFEEFLTVEEVDSGRIVEINLEDIREVITSFKALLLISK